MRIRFIGDPRDGGSGPDVFTLWGNDLPKGEFVDVPDEIAAKVAHNDHFEREGEGEGGSEEIADLRAMLDALNVEYHPRAGVKKLKELLAAAQA